MKKKYKGDVMFLQNRTPETKAHYLKLAGQLLAKHFTEYEHGNEYYRDWRDDPVLACLVIGGKRAGWSKATWRQYRSALRYFMECHGPAKAVEVLESMDCSPCITRANRGPARKQKGLPMRDLKKIHQYVCESRGKHDTLILLWLASGLLTGLRPGEWEKAVLHLGRKVLVVKNAKNTNGRAHGDYRVLDLSDLGEDQMKIVLEFITKLRELVGECRDFHSAYVKCRNRLTFITKKLWPKRKKRPALYSSRHQATADLKASGASLREIAAVLGHATDKTATTHYGRGAAGNGRRNMVHGTEADMERVRTVYGMRHVLEEPPSPGMAFSGASFSPIG